MSNFPSTLSTISDPTATNRLNSPSHSSIETAQNDAVKKLETFVGTLSSAQGTLMYDVRAAASDGGGHVQAANKGGTGQTAYTKGDILVAQSSSVLSKLAVGANNQLLVADNTQDVGIKWTDTAVGRVATKHISINTVSVADGVITSVMSVNIPGSTLGTQGVIRAIIPLRTVAVMSRSGGGDIGRIQARAQYGNSSTLVAFLARQQTTGTVVPSFAGECIVEIISASIASSQRLIFRGLVKQDEIFNGSIQSFYRSSILAEESSSTLALTVSFENLTGFDTSSALGVITDGYVVEKI